MVVPSSHRRVRAFPVAILAAATALVSLPRVNDLAYLAVRGRHGGLTRRQAAAPGPGAFGAMEDLMKDPEKLKQVQQNVEELMKDPEKKKAIDEWQARAQSGVEKLKQDPEMAAFFEDVEKNGMDALKRYEGNDVVLQKFSAAMGGPEDMLKAMGGSGGMGGMGGGMGAGMGAGVAAPAARSFKPGDEVFVTGLTKAPELNGKKAMVVPPTAEERKSLEGTDRMIVRLVDSGDQFAVRPANLETSDERANAALGSDLEDVSLFDPAVQSETAKLRESGKLEDLRKDPELAPIFKDIEKNGMGALEKYWNDDKLMAKISKAMGQ